MNRKPNNIIFIISVGLCILIIVATSLGLFGVIDAKYATVISAILITSLIFITYLNLRRDAANKQYAKIALIIGLIMIVISIIELIFIFFG